MSAAAHPATPVQPTPRTRRGLRGRLQRWWLARHPRTDRWLLHQSNLYILPTRAGWLYALTLAVMLLASINYQLNLGYLLTFLLAGVGLSAMHLTHATLRGLTLHLRPPAPTFAGDAAPVEVVLDTGARARHGIALRFDELDPPGQDVLVDVPAGGQALARLAFVPATRGLHELPTVVVQTRFPLGLFRTWSIWRPAGRLLAYPKPESPAPPLPPGQPSAGETLRSRSGDGGEFDGVRPWRRGDALRSVVWKKVAKSGEMVSRDSASSAVRELWLDWQATQVSGAEARLARMAAWVLAADRAGLRYGLALPMQQIAPDSGDAQRRRALEALALWR